MTARQRTVLLVQLPIPPLGPGPIRGNVPLAAGYLKLFARRRGLDVLYDIEIFPPNLANTLGDTELVEAILARDPWMVGFTCYLWNIDRTLWVIDRLKQRRPDLRVIVGGPEITTDNAWVLDAPGLDYAAIGEGEQTFADLLMALSTEETPPLPIAGLIQRAAGSSQPFSPRHPLPQLDVISSPYLHGILDAADEEMLLLETIRGCVFKCKFCYYPKSYDDLYFLSEELIVANLEHARRRGAKEVVLLDPTLNQRRDFDDFLRLLAGSNPDRQFTYFGELRAEGITETTAKLLRDANFTEVEVGLQSIDPKAMELMDRKNNLRAVERGIRAMRAVGIHVKVDLILGLPGDTVDSARRGMEYLRDKALYDDVQVFNLAILPGTAFRQEAAELGLVFQPRPPYYVRRTPTLSQEDLFNLMQEAQDIFEMDWDPLPAAELAFGAENSAEPQRVWRVDLDDEPETGSPKSRAQAFTLWLRADDFRRTLERASAHIRDVLERNPFTTLQVVLEPSGDPTALTPAVLQQLWSVCQERPTYLDRYYALQPGRAIGAKRLIVLLSNEQKNSAGGAWEEEVSQQATVVCFGAPEAMAEWAEPELAKTS